MKVLLTGAFGNVGSHVLPELLKREHQVRCFDLDTPANRAVARRFEGKAEIVWGDLREPSQVLMGASGVEAVVHLAAVIPPMSDEDPVRAEEVNVGGTRHVAVACKAQPRPPRLLFTSTLDVFGKTQSRPPPRRVGEPIQGNDPYTRHKVACEKIVQESGLTWCIFRLSDVPVMGLRDPHPIMFEIGLDNRIECMHPDDAARAIAGALEKEEAWNRILLVGGGPNCQVTYRDYLWKLLTAMGIGPLPEEAFSGREYFTDWLDSTEAQELFDYQRHTFDDIVREIAACLGWKKYFVPLAKPFARRMILRMSKYYGKRAAA